MINRKLLALTLAGSMLCGCQLDVRYDTVGESKETSSEEETLVSLEETSPLETEQSSDVVVTLPSEAQSQISSIVESSKAEQNLDNIEDQMLPTDEAGEWNDYVLVENGLFHHQFDTDDKYDFGENGVIYDINHYPAIIVHTDKEDTRIANEKMNEYALNNFTKRFQLRNLKVDLDCKVHNELSRFVSYEIAGTVYHTDSGGPYQQEKDYRYYYTIDRMSMEKINLSTAYGINKAFEAISKGDYEVVSADKKVFEKFDNELLARAYMYEPIFADDTEHYLDFYFEDRKVNVVIWVGDELGGYAILRLKGVPRLIKEKDKSIWPEGLETPTTETEEVK